MDRKSARSDGRASLPGREPSTRLVDSNADFETVTTASNYTLDNGISIATAKAAPEPDSVILAVVEIYALE